MLSVSRTCTITITDANDNAPVLSANIYTATLAEDAAPGVLIATISATDADQGTNAVVDFSITNDGGNPGVMQIASGGPNEAVVTLRVGSAHLDLILTRFRTHLCSTLKPFSPTLWKSLQQTRGQEVVSRAPPRLC